MNDMRNLIVAAMFLTISNMSHAQNKCEVLLPVIAKTYDGDCKKGKAHGDGEAKGEIGTYKGTFKKGLPDGEGMFTWSDGRTLKCEWKNGNIYGYGTETFKSTETDSTISKIGYWKGTIENYRFMGENKASLLGYEILANQNLNQGPNFKKNKTTEPKLSIKITDINRSVSSYSLSERSSGRQQRVNNVNGGIVTEIIDIVYPFTATLRYNVPNKTNNFSVPVLLKFTISEPGHWSLNIEHK